MTAHAGVIAPEQAEGNSRLAILISMAMFVLVVDTSLMNVSISAVVQDLGTTVSGVQSAIALEALVSAAFILISSKVGDLIGRKRAYTFGLLGYAVGALAMVLAQDLRAVIIFWAIFGGLGGVYFFEELSRGADGAMTGFPYPEALRGIREHFVAGRRDEARALFYRWLPLIRYESQPGATPGTAVGIRKEILRRRGWIRSAYVRHPASAPDAATLEELTEVQAAVVPA